ncbi:hypothetical protein HK405_005914, partial [Cladochytrium tenue]
MSSLPPPPPSQPPALPPPQLQQLPLRPAASGGSDSTQSNLTAARTSRRLGSSASGHRSIDSAASTISPSLVDLAVVAAHAAELDSSYTAMQKMPISGTADPAVPAIPTSFSAANAPPALTSSSSPTWPEANRSDLEGLVERDAPDTTAQRSQVAPSAASGLLYQISPSSLLLHQSGDLSGPSSGTVSSLEGQTFIFAGAKSEGDYPSLPAIFRHPDAHRPALDRALDAEASILSGDVRDRTLVSPTPWVYPDDGQEISIDERRVASSRHADPQPEDDGVHGQLGTEESGQGYQDSEMQGTNRPIAQPTSESDPSSSDKLISSLTPFSVNIVSPAGLEAESDISSSARSDPPKAVDSISLPSDSDIFDLNPPAPSIGMARPLTPLPSSYVQQSDSPGAGNGSHLSNSPTGSAETRDDLFYTSNRSEGVDILPYRLAVGGPAGGGARRGILTIGGRRIVVSDDWLSDIDGSAVDLDAVDRGEGVPGHHPQSHDGHPESTDLDALFMDEDEEDSHPISGRPVGRNSISPPGSHAPHNARRRKPPLLVGVTRRRRGQPEALVLNGGDSRDSAESSVSSASSLSSPESPLHGHNILQHQMFAPPPRRLEQLASPNAARASPASSRRSDDGGLAGVTTTVLGLDDSDEDGSDSDRAGGMAGALVVKKAESDSLSQPPSVESSLSTEGSHESDRHDKSNPQDHSHPAKTTSPAPSTASKKQLFSTRARGHSKDDASSALLVVREEELQEAPLLLTPRQLRRGLGSGPTPQAIQEERSDSPRRFGGVTPGSGRVDGAGAFRGAYGNVGGGSGAGGSFVRTLRRLFRSKAHNNHNAGGSGGCDDDEGTSATTGPPARPESHATVTETATNESSIPTASSSSVGSPSVSPASNSAASDDSDRRASTPISAQIGVAGAMTASATSSASSSVFAEANAAMTVSSASALTARAARELTSSDEMATLGPRLDDARPQSASPAMSPTIGKGTKVFDRMFPFLRQSGSGSSSSTAARSSATLPAGGAAAAARSIRDRIALAERRDADAAAASARIRPTPTAFRRATQTNSLELSASTAAPASTAGPSLPRPTSQKLTTPTPSNAAEPAAPPPTPLAAVPDLLPCAPVAARRTAATPTLWRLRGAGRRLFFYRVPPVLASIARTDAYVLEAPRTLTAAAGIPSTAVPSLHRASMPALGAGGALDAAGRAATLYVFCGRGAGPVKRARAREFALRVRERDWNRKADVVEFDEGGMKVPAFLDFLRLLGADPEAAVWDVATAPFLPQQQQLGDAGQDGDETAFERAMDASYALFRWDPVTTTFLTVAASARALSVQLLDASSAFILACAADCVYTWSGRLCRPEDRRRVAEFAKEIASAYDGVSVVAERDVGESALFVERFSDWADGLSLHVRAPANVAVPDRSRFVYDRGG